MPDRLTIGVMLEQGLAATSGGSYSYYHALLEALDHHEFGEEIDLKFISVGVKAGRSFRRELIHLSPGQILTTRERVKNKLNHQLIKSNRTATSFLKGLGKRWDDSFQNSLAKGVEEQLIAHGIDLLYYTRPTPLQVNFPYVMTHWDIGHLSMFAFPEVSMNGCFEEREEYYAKTLSKAFAIFCESAAGKEELAHFGRINPDRIFVVPIFPGEVSGLDLPEQDIEAEIGNLGLSGTSFFFYPAQFWSHKNHYNLLAAFRRLLDRASGLQLVLSGSDKGNLSYIRQVISDWGLEAQVRLPGFLPEAAVYSLYRRAVALVMPSFLGPTNMPLLEAQALGCPVICSDFKGHREMLGEGAIYIDPADPASIAEAMDRVLHHPPGRQPSPNAVFNLENALAQMEKSFRALRGRRKAFGFNFNQY